MDDFKHAYVESPVFFLVGLWLTLDSQLFSRRKFFKEENESNGFISWYVLSELRFQNSRSEI